MLESKLTKPYFYIELKVNLNDLMDSRHKLKKQLGVKITTNAFYIHAIGVAASQFPIMVGRLENNGDIRVPAHVNVGFAVNAPQGLVVPVIKNAETKCLADVAIEEKELTDKARSNKLTLDEMSGENIALTNLGPYGTYSFVGIIPPPASTIISVGNIIRTAVPVDGKPQVCKIVSFSLAADYRVIKGTYAASFLNCMKNKLEHPHELV